MDKLEGYAQFPKPKDDNSPKVKEHKKNSKSSNNNYKKNRANFQTSSLLSKDPHGKIDSFEFFEKIKSNK